MNILDACVSGYKSRIDGCNQKGNDYICLCDVYTDVLVCYNNCPNSNEKPPVQNQVTQFCQAAEPLRASASASVASVASVAATQSHAATSTATATGSSDSSSSATGTNSAAVPTVSTFTGAGSSSFGVPAGAAVVAFLGAAGLL
ncbi:hypothetical protein N0V83_008929 [Neocucurbitaria cava]|uniref:Uncharacterized protein n=1 Tax=Neocucurbitaria cava TaxID=798079 RepID=A0A9W8Y206_9PLEO|nr:hypothetical protein N0V83_008929 [Neocucurbitaria cava]